MPWLCCWGLESARGWSLGELGSTTPLWHRYRVCSVLSAVYNVQYTVCIVKCAVCRVRGAVWNVKRVLQCSV